MQHRGLFEQRHCARLSPRCNRPSASALLPRSHSGTMVAGHQRNAVESSESRRSLSPCIPPVYLRPNMIGAGRRVCAVPVLDFTVALPARRRIRRLSGCPIASWRRLPPGGPYRCRPRIAETRSPPVEVETHAANRRFDGDELPYPGLQPPSNCTESAVVAVSCHRRCGQCRVVGGTGGPAVGGATHAPPRPGPPWYRCARYRKGHQDRTAPPSLRR